MNEKVKQVFKKLCENYVRDINQLKGKKIAQDYFYNDEYEVEYSINGEWVATADILKAFDNMEELIKGKDEYIAKLIDDNKKLRDRNTCLRIENANILGKPFLPNSNKQKVVEVYNLNENDITDLINFVKLIGRDMYTEYHGQILIVNGNCFPEKSKEEIEFLMKVVEKYGKEED